MKFKRVFALGVSVLMFTVGGNFYHVFAETAETTTGIEVADAAKVTDENIIKTMAEKVKATAEEVLQIIGVIEKEKQIIDKSGVFPQLEAHVDGEISAVIETNKGNISLRLFPDKAPKAVENFVTHAKNGYYNGVIFHRVIKDFMIQGGDPKGDGTGGESIWGKEFENEVSTSMRSFRGALCMANAGPDTNGSQFYIVQNNKLDDSIKAEMEQLLNSQEENMNVEGGAKVKDFFPPKVIEEYINHGGYPSLDFQYTIFGQVSSGMEVVDAIAAVETDENDKPKENIVINSIKVTE